MKDESRQNPPLSSSLLPSFLVHPSSFILHPLSFMLSAIVTWSVNNRVVVVALAVFLLALGAWAAGHANLAVFPEFAPPEVVVQTEPPGLSPAEVEQLVTLPIETAVNGLPRLAVLRSRSILGLSVVTVLFR